MKIALLVLFCFIIGSNGQKKCAIQRMDDNQSSFVCACNSTYCDEFPSLPKLANDDIAVYTTSLKDKRFDLVMLKFSQNSSASNVTVTVDTSQKFQKIHGFGGAFTDAAGLNVLKLPKEAQQNWINSYFGTQGIGYTVGRVPMGSCDFSTHEYSYDDPPTGYTPENYTDFNLTNFNLAYADLTYKIPLIRMAQELIGTNLRLFACPWSAPSWMKTNYDMSGNGSTMKGDLYNDTRYWGTWSKYFVRDFLKKFLGPAIRAHPATSHLKIMIYDQDRGSCGPYGVDGHQECGADKFIGVVLGDEAAASYVDGVSMHWYEDGFVNASMLDSIHNSYPEKWIMHTEACTGFMSYDVKPAFGNWTRGEQYAHDIIENLNHWSTGWTDWNMVLDSQGGPNWDNNFVDSPTIISNDSSTFYKQPMFYALGHFSKFILQDSIRVGSKIEGADLSLLEGVAVTNPLNQTVLVIQNRGSNSFQVAIKDTCASSQIGNVVIEPMSISTLVWNQQCDSSTQTTQPPQTQGISPIKSVSLISVCLLNIFLLFSNLLLI